MKLRIKRHKEFSVCLCDQAGAGLGTDMAWSLGKGNPGPRQPGQGSLHPHGQPSPSPGHLLKTQNHESTLSQFIKGRELHPGPKGRSWETPHFFSQLPSSPTPHLQPSPQEALGDQAGVRQTALHKYSRGHSLNQQRQGRGANRETRAGTGRGGSGGTSPGGLSWA